MCNFLHKMPMNKLYDYSTFNSSIDNFFVFMSISINMLATFNASSNYCLTTNAFCQWYYVTTLIQLTQFKITTYPFFDGIILQLMLIYEWYYIVPITICNNKCEKHCINDDKHLASIIQFYILIFNVEIYNTHMNFPMVCTSSTCLVLMMRSQAP
jgi:hypothetical protein